jgi:uncharacterized protein (DUF2141 family)
MCHSQAPHRPFRALPWFAAAAALLAPLAASAAQLTVDVVDVERLGGHMLVAVYNDAGAWEAGRDAVATARDSVTGRTVRVFFPGLAPGRYAVKLFHDENNNGELDANMLGVPVENYGFSNGSRRLGPPSFDEAAFELREDTTITISLQ